MSLREEMEHEDVVRHVQLLDVRNVLRNPLEQLGVVKVIQRPEVARLGRKDAATVFVYGVRPLLYSISSKGTFVATPSNTLMHFGSPRSKGATMRTQTTIPLKKIFCQKMFQAPVEGAV